MSIDLKNGELLGLIPKPVPLVEKVARAICDAVIGGQVVRGLVVLEDAGSNSGIDNTADVEFCGGFQNNSFENEEGPEGRGQLSWQCRLKTCRLEAPKETTQDMSNVIGDMSKDMSRH